MLQARAVLGIAMGSFYPQVEQGTGSLLSIAPVLPLRGRSQRKRTMFFWTDTLAMQAAWGVGFWGKFRRGVESADAAYLASIASYDDVLVTLVANVAATYIVSVPRNSLIAITRRQCSQARERARGAAKAKYRRRRGTSELDVFQATNVLTQTRL